MWGGGTSRLLSLSEKKLSSLQESNTQLWLLTFCFPQTKCEGGILQRLAACKHQFRDRGLLGPYSLSLVGIVYSGMLQLCSKTTHMNTKQETFWIWLCLVPGLKLEFGNRLMQLENIPSGSCWSSPSEGHVLGQPATLRNLLQTYHQAT